MYKVWVPQEKLQADKGESSGSLPDWGILSIGPCYTLQSYLSKHVDLCTESVSALVRIRLQKFSSCTTVNAPAPYMMYLLGSSLETWPPTDHSLTCKLCQSTDNRHNDYYYLGSISATTALHSPVDNGVWILSTEEEILGGYGEQEPLGCFSSPCESLWCFITAHQIGRDASTLEQIKIALSFSLDSDDKQGVVTKLTK